MRRAEGAAAETVVDPPRGAANRRLRSALTWIGVLVSIVFAYLAVRDVQLGDVWDGLRSSNYLWLVPAVAMLAVTALIKAIRWRYLFAPETRPPTEPVVTSVLVGYFFNSILPLRAGEVARVVALRRRAGTSIAESSATIIIERAYDVLILLVLLFVTAPWLPEVTWIDTAAALAIALSATVVVAMIVLAVWGLRPLHFVLRPLARLPHLSTERVERLGASLGQGLAALQRPSLVLAAIGFTTLGWLAWAASTWLLMIGFHLDVSFLAALLVVVATSLAMILPSAHSALGVFEAAVLVALGAYGISDADALSFALVLHALNIVPWLVAGVVLLRGLR
jgi:glycosyltransferase 2 family protein